MQWIALFLVAIGAVLNLAKCRWCFVLWLIANVYWLVRAIGDREYALAAHFVFLSATSIVAWFMWG